MFTSCCFCCGDGRQMAPRVRDDEEIGGMVRCTDLCCGSGMSEGRQTQVVLLDDFRLDILVKPKLYAGELLDMVASHFSLKEKEYFGLCYVDDTGHHNWLQLERRVLEHEFPKKSSQATLVLFFRIKYFVESITQLRDNATVEAFYLQAQSLVYQGTVEVSSDQAFHLAALVLQATHGDYIDDGSTKVHLKKLAVIPTSTLIEHPSLTVCEKRVIEKYKALTGLSRGNAIVNYMQLVEDLPTYGVHYYEVKDKTGIPWWLGISYRGICQYDLTDKKVPRKVFQWKQLENLYFRDRKFSIEVCDIKRPTTSRKGFGAGNICVHVWFAVNPSLTKCIWSMAIAQHQFYLDRKHKTAHLVSRNLNEIAVELSNDNFRSNASTNSTNLSRSGSTHSLPALKIHGDSCEELKAETLDMLVALKARKEALEETLHRRSEELKRLCLQEGELTGVLPHEMPLSPGEQIPLTRKRIGSDFTMKERLSWRKKTKEEEELAEIQLEYEIQSKIVSASGKLAADPSAKKGIRRQCKMSHQKAQSKLKQLEHELSSLKKKVEKLRREQSRHYSDDEPSEDNLSQSTDEYELSQKETSCKSQSVASAGSRSSLGGTTSSSPVISVINSPSSSSAPSSPVKLRHASHVGRKLPEKAATHGQYLMPNDTQGYTPSSVYQTRTAYRTQQYPTLPTRLPSSHSAGAVLEHCMKTNIRNSGVEARIPNLSSPYQNKFESTLDIDGSNLYSVPTQRTSQAFDTQDDMLTSMSTNQQDLQLMSRHNSLDRRHRQSSQKYRYLENKHYSVAANSLESYRDRVSYQAHCHSSPPFDEHHPHHYHHHRHVTPHPWTSECERSQVHDAHITCQKHLNEYYAGSESSKHFSACSSDLGKISAIDQRQVHPREQLVHLPEYNSYYIDCKAYQYCEKQVHHSFSTASSSVDSRFVATSDVAHSCVSTPTNPATDFEVVKAQSETYQSTKARLENRSSVSSSSSSSTLSSKHHVTLPKSQSCYPKPVPEDGVPGSSNVEISVVRYGQFQPYWEETKPYEIADFYKYSTKHRKQYHSVNEQLCSSSAAFESGQSAKGRSESMENSVARRGYVQPASSDGNAVPAERTRSQGSSFPKGISPSPSSGDAFHDKLSECYVKLGKVKKTTLV